ncbi:MAG: WD40 repeat domain-containing protein [Xanthomonadaceae bacterium]|nr:WD40 repeat domain-containing protein [Xanthomonadaceae bacterium]MDE2278605.1 WD40 repeat domain-containing protein [Xanthomonadaceae bacterium]
MRKLLFATFALAAPLAALAASPSNPGAEHRIATIAIPGQPLKHFDISAFSSAQGIYGFSDRTNHAVDLIDARISRYAGRVTGFSHGGPNGLTAVGDDQFWAGDGDSKLQVVDIRAHKIVATVDTGGKRRVDELAYDPHEQVVIAANNGDTPPFISFVSTKPGYHIEGKLSFPQATDGLEQPVWNPRDGLVYLSVPVLDHQKADGGIAVIDPRTRRLLHTIHVQKCMPAGLALGPDDRLLVGCSDDAVAAGFAPRSLIIDLRARKVVAKIPQVGGSDEVWYDSGSGDYYLAAVANAGGPVLGVVDARRNTWLRNLPSGNEAHSVAADPHSGQVFVPVAADNSVKGCANGCVEVFGSK